MNFKDYITESKNTHMTHMEDSVIYGGVVGLIFDGRNRPIDLSKESDKRINSLLNWSQAVDEYPKGELF